jgi:hypothetical protein
MCFVITACLAGWADKQLPILKAPGVAARAAFALARSRADEDALVALETGRAAEALLLARKTLPCRLASHPEGLSDPRPGRPQRTGPSHPPRQMLLHLCARPRYPGQARQRLIDADRMLPGRKVGRWGGRAVNQLRAQRHTAITDEHPWPGHQPPYFGIGLQAERARSDYRLLCYGGHHATSVSGYA